METGTEGKLMARLALAGALLMFVVLVSSAYLRLMQGGVGCSDWPHCYGTARLAQTQHPSTVPPEVQWVRVSHRFAATAVAAIVLAVLVIALRKPRRRTAVAMAVLLAALTLFLAVLGIATPYSALPAVPLGNVLGGMTMLGLFWWLRLEPVESLRAPVFSRRALMIWGCGLALLALQIALGALVNANFASRACPDFPGCGGAWWPQRWDFTAFDPWREVDLPPVADAARQTLSMAHRFLAVLVTLCGIGLAALLARRGGSHRRHAFLLALIIVTELGLGVALVAFDLPRAAALAHHAVSSALLIAVLNAVFCWRAMET
jgi:cytochrome c oxidase assembly protein subunit 15